MEDQHQWAGYVVHMPDHRLPKRLFYGWAAARWPKKKKQFKNTLQCVLNPSIWRQSAHNRVNSKPPEFVRPQLKSAGKRNPATVIPVVPCPHCRTAEMAFSVSQILKTDPAAQPLRMTDLILVASRRTNKEGVTEIRFMKTCFICTYFQWQFLPLLL